MKLYTRKDFLDLPKDIIYSYPGEYETIAGLYCKVSDRTMLSDDFRYQDLMGEDDDVMHTGENGLAHNHGRYLRDSFQDFHMNLDCTNRDGMFCKSDTFVVWDKSDITKLRDYLNKCL